MFAFRITPDSIQLSKSDSIENCANEKRPARHGPGGALNTGNAC
jgi:hypothetical protein